MGIPLLHPWANRITERRFPIAGREVAIEPPAPFSTDPNGLAIHGLVVRVERLGGRAARGDCERGVARRRARLRRRPGADRRVPVRPRIVIEARLEGAALTVATTVRATGDAPVPIAFGYHPYLRLPGVERVDWRVEIPVAERLVLDDRMIPTGEREPVEAIEGPLGSRTFDDGYLAPAGSAPFVLTGGGRRIEVRFGDAFPYAQVYAPADDDVIAIEPMTAPTNALVTGGPRPADRGARRRVPRASRSPSAPPAAEGGDASSRWSDTSSGSTSPSWSGCPSPARSSTSKKRGRSRRGAGRWPRYSLRGFPAAVCSSPPSATMTAGMRRSAIWRRWA